jgi:hypothetical protein
VFRRAVRGVWGLCCALCAFGSAGCVQFEKHDDGEGPHGEGPQDGPGNSTTGGATDDTGEPDTGGLDTGETPTTGGGEAQCDLWAQDCPAGSKCMPYDKDGDGIHDARRCVPVDGDPGQAGDDCTIEGSVASGVDTCDVGLMCWNTDANNAGNCVVMCKGSQQNPQCPEDLICDISNGGALILCVQACDPLTPSCPQGQICLPGGEMQFVCDVDASGEDGGYGDPCAFVNVCDQGLLCVSGTSVPGCKTDGCCTEYCDLSMPESVCAGAPDQECAPFYGENAAPPGYENVGVCTIPI